MKPRKVTLPSSNGSLLLSGRNIEENRRLARLVRLIAAEVTNTLKLDDISLLDGLDVLIRSSNSLPLRLGVDEILKLVCLLKLVLGDQVIEVDELDGGGGLSSRQPGDLLLGLLKVTLKVELELEASNLVAILSDLGDEGVTPSHEGNLLALGERGGVDLVDEDLLGEVDGLGADSGVLDVAWLLLNDSWLGAIDDDGLDGILVGDGGKARRNGVNVLLVDGPQDGPLHVDNVLGRSLRVNELAESIDSHTVTKDTTDGREARILPSRDELLLDEPGELTLAHQGADKVDPSKVPDVNLPQVHLLQHPGVLSIAVPVLGGPESVCDTLERVDNGASKVVSGVNLPLGTSPVVGLVVAAVDDGVAHGLVGVVDRYLCPEAVLAALLGVILHLLKGSQVLLDCAVAANTLNTVHALVLHLLLLGIIAVGVSILDHLNGEFVDLVKTVAGIRNHVVIDAQRFAVLEDGVLELLLLLGGVGVVETNNELSIVLGGKVRVEHSSLGVANVHVSGRLWGETSDNALLGVGKANLVVGGRGLNPLLGQKELGGLEGCLVVGNVIVPALDVGHASTLEDTGSSWVALDDTPNGDVSDGDDMADDVCPQNQVIVELKEGIGLGLKVGGSQAVVGKVNPLGKLSCISLGSRVEEDAITNGSEPRVLWKVESSPLKTAFPPKICSPSLTFKPTVESPLPLTMSGPSKCSTATGVVESASLTSSARTSDG